MKSGMPAHLQVGLTAPWAEPKDLGFSPSVGRGEEMHLPKGAVGPAFDLFPEESKDVPGGGPDVGADGAGEIEGDVGGLLEPAHLADQCLLDDLRQAGFRQSLNLWAAGSCRSQHAPPQARPAASAGI